MRIPFFILFLFVGFTALAQGDKPRIEGQRAVATNEDEPVTIRLIDLEVRDRDDWFYPFGFTLTVYPGDNYTVNTHTVTPVPNFNGTLKVKVTVNDGESDSAPFNFEITVRPVNDSPVITGQKALTTNENQSLNIQISDLVISDPDDNQFTLSIIAGSNYTFSGTTITPSPNFSGALTVAVRINDGESTSPVFDLKVDVLNVNDIPRITGQVSLSTDENKPITITLSHVTVIDTDNTFPTGFSLQVSPPANNSYTVKGNEVTPALNFEGTLSVPVRVSDGTDFSAPYNLQITVRPGNNSPVITGQTAVTINEDQVFTLLTSHLAVSDSDNSYPTGFTIKINAGPNYAVASNQITPAANFTGILTVPVIVNDGTSDSAPFDFKITILPQNDPPVLTAFEIEPLIFQPGSGEVAISSSLIVSDPENDSITSAEISFHQQTYTPGFDELNFQGSGVIKGSFDLQKGTLLLTGCASADEYSKALRAVQYNFIAGPDSFIEGKKFSIKLSDKLTTSPPYTREIRTKALDIDLDIPSAFTPNGDSANDTWVIKPLKQSEELSNAHVRVYNRSGQVLFETTGFEKAWDGMLGGQLLPCDSYFYTIDLGKDYVKSSIKGIVTILR